MRYALTSTMLFTLMLGGVACASAQSRAQSHPNLAQSESAPHDQLKELQGIVQTVDLQTRVFRVAPQPTQVSDTILVMTDNSQVKTQGRVGSLTDIQRGTRIKASYQDRYGIKVARQIEIVE